MELFLIKALLTINESNVMCNRYCRYGIGIRLRRSELFVKSIAEKIELRRSDLKVSRIIMIQKNNRVLVTIIIKGIYVFGQGFFNLGMIF